MIDVESVRRNFGAGPYDPKPGAYLPFGVPPRPPLMDNHRSLVHWHQPMGISPPNRVPSTEGPRSDEDDDDDDEDRPFTPPPPRERLSYTRYQLELLNAIYKEVRYPNSTQKQLIAKRVGITREQVKIWFQNRRRKDVVGNSSKAKSCDTSPGGSTCSTDSKDSSIRSSPSPDSAENSSSDETIQSNDSEETVVPDVVLKSVINELLKFVNDPLKGKKKKKRSKSKKDKEKAELKKGLAQTLLRGDYDMLSPPNQITPTAFFEKLKKGFNHAKSTSAFANPRDMSKAAQVSSASSASELAARSHRNDTTTSSNGTHGNPGTFSDQYSHPLSGYPSHLMRSAHSGHYALNDLNIRKPGPSDLNDRKADPSGCDIPVLSDLLSYKQSIEARQRNLMNSSVPHYPPVLQHPQAHQMPRPDFEKSFHHSMNSFMHGRPLNGILPYPFLAEHPVLLSSLRQPDQILRPAPHYPVSSVADDPYQPLLVTSLSNPYFAPPTTSWSMPGQPKYDAPSTSTFTQL